MLHRGTAKLLCSCSLGVSFVVRQEESERKRAERHAELEILAHGSTKDKQWVLRCSDEDSDSVHCSLLMNSSWCFGLTRCGSEAITSKAIVVAAVVLVVLQWG
eukprot:3512949-Amphidinium_carterae.1